MTDEAVPSTETAAEQVAEGPAPTHRSFLRELPVLVIIALVLALLIKHFFVQAFYIPSGSMENTLQIGDRVLVNKVPYYYREPHRGEIVVFNGLNSFDDGVSIAPASNPIAKALRKISSTIGLGAPSEKDYIKRIIGVPGDRVMCCDDQKRVVITPSSGKAFALDEPYVFEQSRDDSLYFCEASEAAQNGSAKVCPPGAAGVLVPKGRLWVMGDHRGNSADSRFHITDANHGTVPISKVVGRAFTVVYPFGRAGTLGVPATFKHVALPAAPLELGLLGALPVVAVRRRRLHQRA
ncbi:MAG: signal peptidase [Frankiales bacterium]|nr:signal peptidase [Frankiales bacterium]